MEEKKDNIELAEEINNDVTDEANEMSTNENEVKEEVIEEKTLTEIEKIISEDEEKAKSVRLILQPMNSQAELRTYLLKNGYKILEEDLALEGFKVYNLIVAEFSGESSENFSGYETEIDMHLPKCLYENPYFEALLEKKKREFSKILDGLKKSKDAKVDDIKNLENGETLEINNSFN